MAEFRWKGFRFVDRGVITEGDALRAILAHLIELPLGSSGGLRIDKIRHLHPTLYGWTWDEIFADPVGFVGATRIDE